MKIHFLNDIHLEFEDFTPSGTDADVVVLAGDIGVGLVALRWIERCFPATPVIYIPGNHEFYHHDISLVHELKHQAAGHVQVLDDDAVEIDGVRFLGCTLWTDFRLFGVGDKFYAMQSARRSMTDFAVIRCNGGRFRPEDAIRLHTRSRDWLERCLAQPYEGKTVVVTHHAPSARSVHPRYERNPLTPAFASDLETLMGANRVTLWLHGHMHDAFDYTLSGTRVVCNPRGYAPDQLSEGFKPDLVLEI